MRGRFVAPFLFDGTTDSSVFNLWLKRNLVPHLDPGMTVIMDNASFHKHPDTEIIIKSASCNLLYLPPYSPDLNPIEHDFANLKRRRSLYPETPLDDLVKTYSYLRN
jgi:transposase